MSPDGADLEGVAFGDREGAAVPVALDSVFHGVAYAFPGCFSLHVVPGWLGVATEEAAISMWEIAQAVLIFPSIPLVTGYLTRLWGDWTHGIDRNGNAFLPRLSFGHLRSTAGAFTAAGNNSELASDEAGDREAESMKMRSAGANRGLREPTSRRRGPPRRSPTSTGLAAFGRRRRLSGRRRPSSRRGGR